MWGRKDDDPVHDVRFIFKTDVPDHAADVVLGRHTKHSVTAILLAYWDYEGGLEYGVELVGLAKQSFIFVPY